MCAKAEILRGPLSNVKCEQDECKSRSEVRIIAKIFSSTVRGHSPRPDRRQNGAAADRLFFDRNITKTRKIPFGDNIQLLSDNGEFAFDVSNCSIAKFLKRRNVQNVTYSRAKKKIHVLLARR